MKSAIDVCREVADLLGLSTLLDRKPVAAFRRPAAARGARPRDHRERVPVCLMDEPLSNLDAQLRAEMRSEIRALQRTLGITMVYVTHDQVEAMSMADRVILLNRGEIEQNGTPVDLYETPANTFVARFIGTPPMNLLAAGRAARWRRHRREPTGRWSCRRECADGLLGVRPEHIALRRRRAACGDGRGRRVPGRRFADCLPPRRDQRSRCAVAGSVGLGRRRRDPPRYGPAARSTVSMHRAARVRAPAAIRGDDARLSAAASLQKRRRRCRMQRLSRWYCRLRERARIGACARAGAGRSLVLLPGRRRRADHEDHRRIRRGLREGESRHQAASRSTRAATRNRSRRR